MVLMDEPLDCPECGSAGSVARWSCEICDADPLPPRVLHPSIPLRFTDVIVELRAIAGMAEDPRGLARVAVAAACRRAESLLLVLRRQFLDEVVLGDVPPSELVESFTSRSSWRSERFTSTG